MSQNVEALNAKLEAMKSKHDRLNKKGLQIVEAIKHVESKIDEVQKQIEQATEAENKGE